MQLDCEVRTIENNDFANDNIFIRLHWLRRLRGIFGRRTQSFFRFAFSAA